MKPAMNLRRANWAAAAVVLALAIQSSMGADTLISTGAVWKYLDTGLDGGSAWRTMAYDDSDWLNGVGKFGFGGGDENTVLNIWTTNDQQIITYYFRRVFRVPNHSIISNLTLRLLRDDGAVVYLNGTEIRRDNMPAGNITYSTLASLQAGDPEERTYLSAQIPPALLVAGRNLLTVEVHQGSTGGGDLGFGLELTANTQTGVSLAAALDTTNLVWVTGGDAPWFGQTQTTHDGVDAAQSGHVPLGASSWLETTVYGPGLLGYSFKVRTENINSEFKLLVDGTAVHRYSLHLGWSGNGYAVPAGRHTLRWLLENPTNGGGSSVAWLDPVVWIKDDDVVELPAVQIVAPARGATFVAPASIHLSAEELPADYAVRSVEFLANEMSLGFARRSSNGISRSWSLIWSNPPAGEYSLGALAIDEVGRRSYSDPIPISVVPFSLPQLCPCNGEWRNHGEYVGCVITHAWQFFRAGVLTVEERREFVRDAIRSDCSKREHEPVQVHILPLTPEECRRDGIQIILSGDADSECVIESSSDLKHWWPMQTNSLTISGSEIIGPPDAAPILFFRARLLP